MDPSQKFFLSTSFGQAHLNFSMNHSFPNLRQSTLAKEGQLLVSKWLASQVLLDDDEMISLMQHLGSCQIYQIDRVVGEQEGVLMQQSFLEAYRAYVAAFKAGELPSEKLVKDYLQGAMTVSDDVLYEIPLDGGKRIIKLVKPAVMLQPHRMHYSSLDGKFRSMVMAKDSFLWGVQFSYPQIYQNPKTFALEKIAFSDAFPNSFLFDRLRKWVRYNTLPTPFIVNNRKMTSSVRLGKKCFGWINKHLQLQSLGITVPSYSCLNAESKEE